MVEIVTPPTGVYLTTLPAVKQELLIPSSDASADIFLGGLIAEATETVYAWAGRPLYRAQYRETLRGTDCEHLTLSRYPVASVESVLDSYGSNVTSECEVLKDPGFLARGSGFPNGGLVTESRWVVTYTAGWFMAADDFILGSYTVSSVDNSYNNSSSYIHPLLRPGDIVLAQSFATTANNGLKVVETATTSKITVTTALTTETLGSAEFYVRNLPGWIERACLDLIRIHYHGRDRDPAITTFSVGPQSVGFEFEKRIDAIRSRVEVLAQAN